MIKNYLIGLVLATGMFLSSGSAFASTCPVNINSNVVATPSGTNSGCELGSVNNDNPLPGQVNADTMFTYADWVYAGKDNDLNGVDEAGTVNIGLTLTGTTFAGNWSVNSNVFNLYEMVMLVFKGGNGQGIVPETYVGYLFDKLDGTSGTYITPFSKNGPTAISHVSAYVRGIGDCPSGNCATPVGEVPLPAGILLLISALSGLGFLARFRKAALSA